MTFDAASLSDPKKARLNLFRRDMLLAGCYRRQHIPLAFGYTLVEIDGGLTIRVVTDMAGKHFAWYDKILR